MSYSRRLEVETRGGWNIRDERFAELIEKAILTPGDTLTKGFNNQPCHRDGE